MFSQKQISKFSMLLLAFTFTATSLFAQNLTVTGEETAKETEIVFNMVNEKPAEIYQILSFSQTSGISLSTDFKGDLITGSTSSNGTNTSFLCTTPNKIKLDRGEVKLQVGNTEIGSAIFTVRATGGKQIWDIRAMNQGLSIGGFCTTLVGLVAAITGIGIMSFDIIENNYEDMKLAIPLAAAGLGVTVGGGIMMAKGNAKATLVKIEL